MAVGAKGKLLRRIEPPASRRDKDIAEGSSSAVETQHIMLGKAGAIKMAVGTEDETIRSYQTPASGGDKGVYKGASDAVETQHFVGCVARDIKMAIGTKCYAARLI